LRWLQRGEDGKLKLPISSSPEIHDNGLEAWLTPNSNYDLALIIYLFKTLQEMSQVLDNEDIAKWNSIIDLLPDLAIDNNYVLMLSPDEKLIESHRHHSHMMSIHPLNLLEFCFGKEGQKIMDATIADIEKLGTGLWVGFSFAWMAEFYARQGNGEGSAYQLKIFWECFCSKNGFNLNGDYKKRGLSALHYRPFTLEANMCAADALQEMLLQTYDGIIHVFPAIPQEWLNDEVSFSGFRGEGGIIISSQLKNGSVCFICLKSEVSGKFYVRNRFNSNDIVIVKNGYESQDLGKPRDIFTVNLQKGESCIIKEKLPR
jgi:alpha-L-fucosidase 2